MLKINNLKASIEENEILNDLCLECKPGEIHAIMGPNGSGKSTLSKVITGHPDFEEASGSVELNGKELMDLDPDERANEGLFLAFQYPVEIPGVNNAEFLRMAYNAKLKHNKMKEIDPFDFELLLKEKLNLLGMSEDFLERSVNHGFSGGEKKRNEILQLLVLNPDVAVLDETDSGLDIDALKDVSEAVNKFHNKDKITIVITHYQRLLNYIKPDYVHVLIDGKIVKTGDKNLALDLEDKGYDWLIK